MSETEPQPAFETSAEPTIDSLVHDGPLAQPSLFRAIGQVAAGGAAFGALAGFSLLSTLIVFAPGVPIAGAIPAGLLFGATFGAFCGALLAPSLGFLLFRHVPLWRLYGYSTVGTVIGGLLGALARIDVITGALAGLAAGLVLVQLRSRVTG